ncbi:MAG TPA: alpha/beta hydrolase [Cytophagales bacterium]|jgi:monoterpene epsilon-lactone hydrolase|nr:alpha/beta hydrolase [Cytophagales bacterium]
MPSWKHNVLKNALNTLSVPMYWKLPPIDHLRGLLETFTMFATLPWGVSRGEVEFKEFRADWLVPDKRSAEDVILYLHGGGYVIGSPHSHRGLAGKIAKDAGMACLLIDYRKAPEYPFPYALYDAYKAYEYLLGQGYEPGHIFIIGDSAGGGLTLSLSLKLKMDKMPLPAANVLLSPYVDLVNNEDDRKHNAKNDRFLDVFEMRRWAELYAAGHDLSDPLISPLFGNLAGLPPMLIQASTSEVLYEDANRLYQKAKSFQLEVEFQTWQGLIHWWHMFGGMPEAKEAIDKIVDYIKAHIGKTQHQKMAS